MLSSVRARSRLIDSMYFSLGESSLFLFADMMPSSEIVDERGRCFSESFLERPPNELSGDT